MSVRTPPRQTSDLKHMALEDKKLVRERLAVERLRDLLLMFALMIPLKHLLPSHVPKEVL